MKQEIKVVKAHANQAAAEMQVGKNGITGGILAEAKRRLEHHQIVKIRVLKNCEMEPSLISETMAKALSAQVLSQKGQTIALYKKAQNKPLESKKS